MPLIGWTAIAGLILQDFINGIALRCGGNACLGLMCALDHDELLVRGLVIRREGIWLGKGSACTCQVRKKGILISSIMP